MSIKLQNYSSIQAAHNLDGLVFWGTGDAILKIPNIIQSVFMHCLLDHQPGLIEKWLVNLMNMAKCMYEQHNKLIPPPLTIPTTQWSALLAASSGTNIVSSAPHPHLSASTPSIEERLGALMTVKSNSGSASV
ncbi:hypothetical protein BS47DRAFT_1397564 [Hydnum rufescens UP504]|uniref:Uncharacterized protein n=1 Tax=Hydnum rufescens UP504 TaxID=1448309 RepID=A0A9P6DP74_9AGAM|nr:hypothetical protein BS47DRAFT_1397564 [Hydnum rufescens UP504]